VGVPPPKNLQPDNQVLQSAKLAAPVFKAHVLATQVDDPVEKEQNTGVVLLSVIRSQAVFLSASLAAVTVYDVHAPGV